MPPIAFRDNRTPERKSVTDVGQCFLAIGEDSVGIHDRIYLMDSGASHSSGRIIIHQADESEQLNALCTIRKEMTPESWLLKPLPLLEHGTRPVYQILDLNNKSVLPSNPRQAFKNISSAFLCLPKLFTTPVPGLTRGAFNM